MKLWEAVRDLADEHLNKDRLVREQEAGKWNHFIQTATAHFPIFARFYSSWPVRVYVTNWLAKRKYCKKTRKTKQSDKENIIANAETASTPAVLHKASKQSMGSEAIKQESRDTTDNIAESFDRPRKTLRSTRSGQVYVQMPPKATPSSSQSSTQKFSGSPVSTAPSVASSSQASTSTLLSSHGTTASQTSTTQSTTSSTDNSSDYVIAFLASLSPPMPYLWPTFERLGISDAECLHALAARPDSRLDRFFEKLVERKHLSELQVDTIVWGLKEMVGGAE
ncbi:hypothetical protein OE88DRAFT_451161 [Heliocybe sulcata]|uniref:Uncharacterized protein n=1 Tax=Heliocybe sulcata TaxID=5364 RepID=A0A5C3MVE3_9AGAM|nr:hypothetical protein OE88DRAFT_451161 [Heliocybe sulcata]